MIIIDDWWVNIDSGECYDGVIYTTKNITI